MKQRISDLLNDISVEDVRIREKTPLSERRICWRTMDKIAQKKKRIIRWLPRVAMIAAVIMVMTVTVFAADVVWNDGALLSVFFGKEPSTDEMQLMDDIGCNIGDSVTENGATVTAIQAVADNDTVWIHLRVEAPEGVILPDIPDDDTYFYYLAGRNLTDVKLQHRESEKGKWQTTSTTHSVKPIPDHNPEDNTKEFIVIFYSIHGGSFNRGGELRLIMPGLYIHKGKSSEQQTLFTGRFVFDIAIDAEKMEQRNLVVDAGNVSFYNEEYDYTTTVEKITISPLHVDISCTYTEPNCKYIFPYGGPLDIVMKDGTVIHALDAYSDAREQNVADPDDVTGARLTCLDAPIVVENIDYIVLGGEYTFDVN